MAGDRGQADPGAMAQLAADEALADRPGRELPGDGRQARLGRERVSVGEWERAGRGRASGGLIASISTSEPGTMPVPQVAHCVWRCRCHVRGAANLTRTSSTSAVRKLPPPAAAEVATTMASIVGAMPVIPASRLSSAADRAMRSVTGITWSFFDT